MKTREKKGKRLLPLLMAVALVTTGCGGVMDPEEQGQRGKLGKADGMLSGSCKADDGEEYCGGMSAGYCWCDDSCAFWGDCCLDAAESCSVDECTYGDDTTCPEGYTCRMGRCDRYCPPGASDCCTPNNCEQNVPSECEELGGTCMIDPMDPTFPAKCEEMGLVTLDGACPMFNQSCCGQPEPIPCGGFAGLPCPAGMVCVDDPSDDCDPQNGGADCIGMCIEVGGGPCWPTVEPDDEYYGRFEAPFADNDCESNGDCVVGGCSGEVCAAEPMYTTCEALPTTPYGSCGCLEGKCQWHVCAE